MVIQVKHKDGHRIIVKWNGERYENGWPKKGTVFAFVINPEIRAVLGRWVETPNVNTHFILSRLSA